MASDTYCVWQADASRSAAQSAVQRLALSKGEGSILSVTLRRMGASGAADESAAPAMLQNILQSPPLSDSAFPAAAGSFPRSGGCYLLRAVCQAELSDFAVKELAALGAVKVSLHSPQ